MHRELAWVRIQFRKRNIRNGSFPTALFLSVSLSLSSFIPAHFCAWVEQLFHWTWPTKIMQRFNHKYFGSWNRIKSTFIFKLQNLHEHFSSRCASVFFSVWKLFCLLQSHILGNGDDDASMRLTDYTCVLVFVNICSIFNKLKIVACRLSFWIWSCAYSRCFIPHGTLFLGQFSAFSTPLQQWHCFFYVLFSNSLFLIHCSLVKRKF